MPSRSAHDLDLALYAVFVAIAEAKSLTAASKRLHTTKATVSRSLVRLEELLGTELVHRSTRSLSLSTAGASLYERVAPSVTALQVAAGEVATKRDVARGTLRITAPADLGVHLLPDVLALCAARWPEVRVEVHLTNDVVDLVGGGFDLALRIASGAFKSSGLTVRKLASVGMGVFASPSYLRRHGAPARLGDDDHEWLVQTSGRRALGSGARLRTVSNDMLLLRDLAARGIGVALLPVYVASAAVVAGDLVRVLPTASLTNATCALVYPSSGQVARKIEVFRDAVIETLRTRPLPA